MAAGEQHLAFPMIVVLEQHNAHRYRHLIDEMFRLRARILSSEPKCNTPADLIIGIVDQDLRECCHAMLFAFVG